MADDFKWTDELVAEFTTWSLNQSPTFQGRYTDIEKFKASKQKKRDWIIVDWDMSKKHSSTKDVTNEAMIECGCQIKSVKRLSDGEVFTVGDKVLYAADGLQYQIRAFTIWDDKMFMRSLRDDVIDLDSITKAPVKKPLFTTKKGEGVFDGDEFWIAIINSGMVTTFTAKETDRGYWREAATFLTKEAAEEYILLNKPVLSVNDVKKIYLPGSVNSDTSDTFWVTSLNRLKQLVSSKIKGEKNG